jgi:phosphonate transport system permease protein
VTGEAAPFQAGERRTWRWLMVLLLAAVVVGAFSGAKFDPTRFFGPQAARGSKAFFSGCWPPRTDAEFLGQLASAAVDTVSIAALGTAVALFVGFPLGILGSRGFVYGARFASHAAPPSALARGTFVVARFVGGIFRSIPEVVWALLFVRVTGLGALPAIAGLGIAYGGLLGKVFSEQLEDVHAEPVAALESVGAGRVAAFAWGALPQAFGAMASYTAYRFECAIRASTIMGFVGAGGIGFRIMVSEGDDLYGEIVTETAFLVAIVAVVEGLSDLVRRRLA